MAMAAQCGRMIAFQMAGSRSGSALRTSSSRLILFSAAENARSAWPIAGITTSFNKGGTDGRIAGVLDGAGGAKDVVGGDAAPLAGEFVAAAWPADALEDADPDQGLQHRLQMTGREGMAGGQCLRGYRMAPAMKGDVDDCSNREKSLAGKQRHAGTAFVIPYNGMILRPAFPLFVNWLFAGGTEAPRAPPCFIELFRL